MSLPPADAPRPESSGPDAQHVRFAQLALLASCLLAALLVAGVLLQQAASARRAVLLEGHSRAEALADRIADRLDLRLRQLRIAGSALLRAGSSTAAPREGAGTGSGWARWLPGLRLTRLTPSPAAFAPLTGDPGVLLGKVGAAAPAAAGDGVGAVEALPMRLRVADAQAQARCFVASSYPVAELLATQASAALPWRLRVVDERDGRAWGSPVALGALPRSLGRGDALELSVPVPGYPFVVRARAPAAYLASRTWDAVARPGWQLGMLLLALAGAAAYLALVLRSLQGGNLRLHRAAVLLARGGQLQEFVAQANQAAAEADDEIAYLRDLCARAAGAGGLPLAMVLRPRDDGLLMVAAAAGRLAPLDPAALPLRVASSQQPTGAGRAWLEGRALFNLGLHDTEDAPWATAAAGVGLRAVSLLPIRREGSAWALLLLYRGDDVAFEPELRHLLLGLAHDAGLTLERIAAARRLRVQQESEHRLARTDPLTGLPNRLALDEYLPGALARAQRRQEALAVGLLDLDDFKPVNDSFGHAAGDVLLGEFATRLRARLRQSDFLARAGGDEFVVVLEALGEADALSQIRIALDRLHAAVEQPFDLGEGRLAHVGMTMGLALYPRDAGDGDALLRQADGAMYAGKARKAERGSWWRIGAQSSELPELAVPEEQLDVFGAASSLLLQSIDTRIFEAVATAFSSAFYDELAHDESMAPVLRTLSAPELDRLKIRQAAHLLSLFQPGNTREALEGRAREIGRIHALVGLAGASMERSFGLYEDLLRRQLESTPIAPRVRYRMLRIATARLRLEIQTQLAAMDEVADTYAAVLSEPVAADARWVDVLPAMLEALAALPGVRHVAVFRPDEHGVLHIESGAGAGFDRVAERLEQAHSLPNLNPILGRERGPLSMAWFTRELQVVDSFLLDPRLQPWRALAQASGWRSAAALPIADGEHADSVLILCGAYPNQFASHWARSWLDLLHGRIQAQFAATSGGQRPLPPAEVRAYRQLLYGGGLSMWVQPIAHLQTGAVVKAEALARLQGADGAWIPPGRFLPAFGTQELHALFRQGLEQALESLHGWRDAGLDVEISINLPPVSLAHPDCASWVEQALRQARVAPEHLTLEILETQQIDVSRCDQTIHALDALGVRLALDDLGAGYGSLTRLASLPFDTVKIDQSLLANLPRDPMRTLRLLASLERIGREFAERAVVEGLEEEGFIEVARLLGAEFGQGYGIARPMPAADFLGWMRARGTAGPTAAALRTWPGALALHWAVTRDPQRAAAPGPVEHCALTAFLRKQGVDDPEVLHWHAQVHGGHDGYVRDAASQALMHWLAKRVSQAYARPAVAAA